MKDPNSFWVWAVVAALLFLIVPYLFGRSSVLIWGLPLWFVVSAGAAVFLAVFTAVVICSRWSLVKSALHEDE